MRKTVTSLILALACLAALTGCGSTPAEPVATATPAPPDVQADATPRIVHEGESVLLVREMMALDYGAMTVAQFNETIQQLCAQKGTDIFAVIADAYDHYVSYNDADEFAGHAFTDRALESFMKTTLEYSAGEIFGEPVYTASVMDITAFDMTALETDALREGMSEAEWQQYFEQNIENIEVFPVVTYAIDASMKDPQTMLVAERDKRLNDTHAAIKAYWLGLSEQAAASQTLWDETAAELEKISAAHSDEEMSVMCWMQSLERDGVGAETMQPVPAQVTMHEGTYFDERFYEYAAGPAEESPLVYCEFTVSGITDTSFDFGLRRIVMATGEQTELIGKATAFFVGEGRKAVCEHDGQTLTFTFADERQSLPDVVDMQVSGLDELEGNSYVNNGVPGHEFG